MGNVSSDRIEKLIKGYERKKKGYQERSEEYRSRLDDLSNWGY